MESTSANSLDRILSRRSLIRGHARAATLWSVAAMLTLILLLLNFGLLLGLLADRGRIELNLSPAEVTRFESLTGLKVTGKVTDVVDPADDASTTVTVEPTHVFYDEHGILPIVWRARDYWWGGLVAKLYREVGWLQTNILALIWILSVGVILFVFRTFCLSRHRYHCYRFAIDGVAAARRQLHRQAMRLGPEDLDGTGQEQSIQLFVEEVDSLRKSLCESISIITRFPWELAGLLLVVFSLYWRLSLQRNASLALGLLILSGIRRTARQKSRLAEDRSRDEQQVLLASFKNARLTRGLGIEREEHEQFQKHLDRYHSQLTNFAWAEESVNRPHSAIVLAGSALMAALLFLACITVLSSGRQLDRSGLTIAEAIVFVTTVAVAIPGLIALRALPGLHRELSLGADKIQRYLNRVPAVSQAVGAKFLQPMSKTLHFENVKYQTPSGQKILDGVDFKLEVDKCYSITSANPLEARAVALMLPRFIEPREGSVMIDGEDISWVTLESLRAETVFVAADDPPFEGTVFDNIRGGQADLTLQQVTEAAKLTHAHNFIVKLFNGYETVLTSQGDTLDAGQRFRLGLARAIVRNPALLIVEEPWSPLDEDTKTLLVDAYDRICRNRTVIFLPARLSTVRRTDQVIVLHEGKVAAIGPHAKLVSQSPIYRHWEYIHFNEFRNES